MSELATKDTFIPAFGRAVDPAWAEHYADFMRAKLRTGLTYVPRKHPGVVYVGEPELNAIDVDYDSVGKDEAKREAYLQRQIDALLDSLYDHDELDTETTTQGALLAIHEPSPIVLKFTKTDVQNVGIRIDDVPSKYIPNDDRQSRYVVEGEREVFTEVIGRHGTKASLSEKPRHSIYLGKIIGGNIELAELPSAEGGLVGPVPLLGVGVLRLETT